VDIFKKHPKPWQAEPMWKSTKTPWVLRDGHHKIFANVDDEQTARAIVALTEDAKP
jgi:hypothetical protein